MNLNEKKKTRLKVHLVSIFFLLGLCTILGRAFQLQILQGKHLSEVARGGYTVIVKLPPKRGTIYDRQRHELALSVELGSVFAHPRQIQDKEKAAVELGRVLGVDPKEIQTQIEKDRSFVWLQRRIPPNITAKVSQLQIQGVGTTAEASRFYPCNEVGGHVLGFVGTDFQGLEGLEKTYDHLLRGPERQLVQMRDALKRPFAIDRVMTSEQKPHDLVLTIDKDIQYKAQQALKDAVIDSRAVSGNMVCVDPNTGAILAMAVYPEFNPNTFGSHRPEHWRNRTITDWFEPGSTAKTFLLSSALEEGVVTPYTAIDCEQGSYKIGRRVIHDTHEHGILTAADIVVQSSNIGATKIGQRLGYQTYHRYLKRFGFEQTTGIELAGERSGFLRPPEKARTIDQATAYFGQGLTMTTLQLVMAMAAIANGGTLMRPYIVQTVEDPMGTPVFTASPQPVRRVISERTARTMASIMEGVTQEGGTATKAAIPGFHVGGKTGTAQKVDPNGKGYARGKYIASFVGFVPSDKPRLVMAVVLDEPRKSIYGGVVAAPVFREVAQAALNHLRIPPQIRWEEKEIEIVHEASAGETIDAEQPGPMLPETGIPDFRGLTMREVLIETRSLGLEASLVGTGFAVRQDPPPGTEAEQARPVTVFFEPPAG